MAVNVGDALIFLGLRALLDNAERLGLPLAMRVLIEAEQMVRETVEGQSIELGWRRDNAIHLRESDYLNMILKKTCWYTTIFPLRAGALIGSRDDVNLDRFIRFGFFAGAAFQIQDDLLNLIGDPAKYGKELNGDIQEGKRTLMLIHLLEHVSPEERIRLDGNPLAAATRPGAGDVAWIRERMEAHFDSVRPARRSRARRRRAACFRRGLREYPGFSRSAVRAGHRALGAGADVTPPGPSRDRVKQPAGLTTSLRSRPSETSDRTRFELLTSTIASFLLHEQAGKAFNGAKGKECRRLAARQLERAVEARLGADDVAEPPLRLGLESQQLGLVEAIERGLAQREAALCGGQRPCQIVRR